MYIELNYWNTGGETKYRTALYFTSDKKTFPEQFSKVMISDPDNGENWFVDFKAGNEKYIVFRDKILKCKTGNQTEREIMYVIGATKRVFQMNR